MNIQNDKYRILVGMIILLLVIIFPNRYAYSECVKGDCMNGNAVLAYPTIIYEGPFKDGLPNGKGICIINNQEKCITMSSYDSKTNELTMTIEGLNTYWKFVGMFNKSTFDGHGTLTLGTEPTLTNVAIYTGQFKDFQFNGKGMGVWFDGTKYEGEFKNNMRNGYFTVTYPDGTKKSGIWKNDQYMGEKQ